MRKQNNTNVVSNQQLLDCSHSGCYGCRGGWPKNALDYVLANGITNDATYPYLSSENTCAYKNLSMTGHINATYEVPTRGNMLELFFTLN